VFKLNLRPIPFKGWLRQIIYFALLLGKVKTLSSSQHLYLIRLAQPLKGIERNLSFKRDIGRNLVFNFEKQLLCPQKEEARV